MRYRDGTTQRSAGIYPPKAGAGAAKRALERGDHVAYPDQLSPHSSMLFGEYVTTIWWPAWKPAHPRSAKGTSSKLTARILPRFGNLPLTQLDAHAIAAWQRDLTREGLSARTIATYLSLRQHVRLVHLCVAKRYRGRGIARLLIEEVDARHRDRLGIILRCRRDHPAHHMWPSLGFRPRHETRGRGRKETVLVAWWRERGHPDLFSIAESYAVLRVALDFNVFLDLHTPQPRSGSVDSLALNQDWLRDQVELVVTSEVYAEIDEAADQRERARLRGAAAGYVELRADARRVQEVADKLIARVLATHQVDLSKDSNDLHDVRHVAEASVAGVPVLATRDDRLVKLLSDAAIEIGGVLVLHPADVVVRLDELTRAQVYRPAYLLDTQYTAAAVASGDTSELEHVFLDRPRGERRSDFVARLRRLATSPQQWERTVVRDPSGQAAAIYACGQNEAELTVPIIRISSSKLGATIARQLLLLLRQRCRALGLSRLRLTDPFTSEAVVTAAVDDGFYQHGQDLLALVINACAPAAAISEQLSQIRTALAMKIPTIASRPPASTAAALERTLWPVKIIGAELPTFLIPIRPVWSSQLFGVPPSLLPRPALLGMSASTSTTAAPLPRWRPRRRCCCLLAAGRHHPRRPKDPLHQVPSPRGVGTRADPNGRWLPWGRTRPSVLRHRAAPVSCPTAAATAARGSP